MNWFKKLFKTKPKYVEPLPSHAFCENVAAGSASPWHIRILTEEGKKLGGGADTPAMCGHVVHWDRQYPVSRGSVFLLDKDVCSKCATAYMKATEYLPNGLRARPFDITESV